MDEAAAIADVYERWERFGNLLEWAIDDRRHRENFADYMPIVAMLRARVGRALDELRTFIASAENPERPMIDYEKLALRLEQIRLARTEPQTSGTVAGDTYRAARRKLTAMAMPPREGPKSSREHLVQHLAQAARTDGTLEFRVGAEQLFLRTDKNVFNLGLPDPYADAIFALRKLLGQNDRASGTLYGFDVDIVRDVEGDQFLVRAHQASNEPLVDLTALLREAGNVDAPRQPRDLAWHRAALEKAERLPNAPDRSLVVGMLLERAIRDAKSDDPAWEQHVDTVREAFVAATAPLQPRDDA
jgi:hypothetical protein